jgi:MFS family permease
VFLSSAADMVQNVFGYDASYAALVTSWMNLVNFTGRFGWGYVTDKIGRKAFWLLSTATQTVALAAMTAAIPAQNFGLWLLSFLLIGSLYGGGFGVLPAYLSDLFGPRISAATHGVMIGVWAFATVCGIPIFTAVTSAYSVAAVNPATGALVRTPTPHAYVVNATWLAFLPALAFCVSLFLNVRREDRRLRKAVGGAAARLPGGRLALCTCTLLSPAAQEAEYARVGARAAGEGEGEGAVAKGEEERGEGKGGEGAAWAAAEAVPEEEGSGEGGGGAWEAQGAHIAGGQVLGGTATR